MKFRLKPKQHAAVQWKGWPHQIKGMMDHPKYSQLGYLFSGGRWVEVYKNDWVVTFPDGNKTVMTDYKFEQTYERVK